MSEGSARWRGDLGAYVIGALEPREGAAVRRHLGACAACRAVHEELVPVRDWLAEVKRHLTVCAACRADYAELL